MLYIIFGWTGWWFELMDSQMFLVRVDTKIKSEVKSWMWISK